MDIHHHALPLAGFANVPLMFEAAATIFYGLLFAFDQASRPLFKGDMTAQGRKLRTALESAVANLPRLDAMLPTARDRGHAGYRVNEARYETVEAAALARSKPR